jgi:IS30 family transposase
MLRLTSSEKVVIAQWAAAGVPSRQSAREIGRASRTVHDYVQLLRRRPPRPRLRSCRQLSLAEREEISRGLAEGRSLRVITTGIGRRATTVCREVARNGGRGRYRGPGLRTVPGRQVGDRRRRSWLPRASCGPRWRTD